MKKKLAFAEKFLNDAKIRETRFQKIIKSLKEENKTRIPLTEFTELKAFVESVMEENKKLKESKAKVKIELQEMETLLKKSMAANRKLKEMRLYDDDELELEEDEDDLGDTGFAPINMESTKGTNKVRFMNEQVQSWFLDKKKATPGIDMIKEDLARCRNMREAYKVFYAQEDLLEEKSRKPKVRESVLTTAHPKDFSTGTSVSDVSVDIIRQRPGWV